MRLMAGLECPTPQSDLERSGCEPACASQDARGFAMVYQQFFINYPSNDRFTNNIAKPDAGCGPSPRARIDSAVRKAADSDAN